MITTPRLHIRALRASDLHHMHAYRSDPAVLRYQDMSPMDLPKAQAFIEEMKEVDLSWVGKWMQLAIELTTQERLIGDLALKFDAYNPRVAEIGYTLHPKFRGIGYATEAVKHLLQYIFAHQDTHRIVALVDIRNPDSFQLLERLGFQREGHYRKSYFDEIDQDWFDEYRYGLLKTDWGTDLS